MLQIPAKSAFPRGVENLWPVHDMRPQFLGPRVSGERRELDESEKRVTGSEGNLGNYGEEKNDDDHMAAIDEAMLVYDSDHELVRLHCLQPFRCRLELTLQIVLST